MTITIGTLSFDNVEYDADADVLYLSVGEPRMPAESFGTRRLTAPRTSPGVRSAS